MKKLIALLLSVLMVLSLTACEELEAILDDEIIDSFVSELMEEGSQEEDTSEDASSEEDDLPMTETAETEIGIDTDDGISYTQSDGSGSETASYIGGDFSLDEDGTYTTYEDVALYIATYEHLPENFMTKKEARELGWNGGGLDDYAYGMCIGGDYFGNKEGVLPTAKGRTYHECDIDTLHANKRGAERIVYSNDGLVYYTSDHYETFTLLYGEE